MRKDLQFAIEKEWFGATKDCVPKSALMQILGASAPMFPKIVISDDYHEFSYIQKMFAKFGVTVSYKELVTDKVSHAAIFYVGQFDDACQQLIDQFK